MPPFSQRHLIRRRSRLWHLLGVGVLGGIVITAGSIMVGFAGTPPNDDHRVDTRGVVLDKERSSLKESFMASEVTSGWKRPCPKRPPLLSAVIRDDIASGK